jgi:hypothetical protein
MVSPKRTLRYLRSLKKLEFPEVYAEPKRQPSEKK